jgi:hypothetical protein
MMVTPDSARQYYHKEKLVSADSDHSQIAKIKKGQNGIYPAIKSAIKHGLASTAEIVAGAGETNAEISPFAEQVCLAHSRLTWRDSRSLTSKLFKRSALRTWAPNSPFNLRIRLVLSSSHSPRGKFPNK